tara:strand:+ start:531 stop:704 length:174 start_codon:yes stop_codon:yes gene_type:complete
MKVSKTLQVLAESLAPTVGNRIVKGLLLEMVEEVFNLELERDDAIEELLASQELANE